MIRRLWLSVLALALVAPAALASVPRSGASLGAPDLAPLSLPRERALATGEVVDSSSGLALFRGDELRPQPLTVFEPSYPETRVGAFDFLGSPLVGVTSGVSHGLHWGCGDSWLETSEGLGKWLSEDPAGDIDSPNRYAYVAWQPNMATDPTGALAFAFVPVLMAGFGTGLTAKFFIDSTAEEIERSSSVDPQSSVFWAGARGFARAGVITAVTGGIAGGVAGPLARTGMGLAGRYAIGGLVAGPAGVLASDVIDVNILGARSEYSSPLVYAGAGLLGGGAGFLGGWAGARYADEAAGVVGGGWNTSRTRHAGLGLGNDVSFFSFSRGWGAANDSAAEYQAWLTATNLRGGLRSAARGAAAAVRGFRRALSVEDHHLIPQNLWESNPILGYAESVGISRNALWNVRPTFGHRGGHAQAYYATAGDMVNTAFAGQTISALSAAEIEGTLAATARSIQLGIRWGRVPTLARMFGRPTVRLY